MIIRGLIFSPYLVHIAHIGHVVHMAVLTITIIIISRFVFSYSFASSGVVEWTSGARDGGGWSWLLELTNSVRVHHQG
jgi:hypothetical protein